ncbi:hypothetical protein SNEBB_006411 [Seison nebaliae]|nr:hypothetical protein SNEBB_006411 [Seison nebaliae]
MNGNHIFKCGPKYVCECVDDYYTWVINCKNKRLTNTTANQQFWHQRQYITYDFSFNRLKMTQSNVFKFFFKIPMDYKYFNYYFTFNYSHNYLKSFRNPTSHDFLNRYDYMDLSFNRFRSFILTPDYNRLKSLNISHNKLEYFSGRLSTKENILTRLDLSYNELTSITRNEVGSLSKIEYLDLSNNQIKVIEADALDQMNGLRYLLLNNNQLKIFSNLKFTKESVFVNLCNNSIVTYQKYIDDFICDENNIILRMDLPLSIDRDPCTKCYGEDTHRIIESCKYMRSLPYNEISPKCIDHREIDGARRSVKRYLKNENLGLKNSIISGESTKQEYINRFSMVAVIIGSVVGFVMLVILITIFIVRRRRLNIHHRRKNEEEEEKKKEEEQDREMRQMVNLKSEGFYDYLDVTNNNQNSIYVSLTRKNSKNFKNVIRQQINRVSRQVSLMPYTILRGLTGRKYSVNESEKELQNTDNLPSESFYDASSRILTTSSVLEVDSFCPIHGSTIKTNKLTDEITDTEIYSNKDDHPFDDNDNDDDEESEDRSEEYGTITKN